MNHALSPILCLDWFRIFLSPDRGPSYGVAFGPRCSRQAADSVYSATSAILSNPACFEASMTRMTVP